MKLSPNFDLSEFTESPEALELGIDNTPNALQVSRLQSLCDNVLTLVRIRFNKPVHILSGFRCPALNTAVGGEDTSQHKLGEAADFVIPGIRNDDIWQFIVDNLSFDQLIAEKLRQDDGNAGWIHVSHKKDGKQRGEALSFLGDGVYVPGLKYI